MGTEIAYQSESVVCIEGGLSGGWGVPAVEKHTLEYPLSEQKRVPYWEPWEPTLRQSALLGVKTNA